MDTSELAPGKVGGESVLPAITATTKGGVGLPHTGVDLWKPSLGIGGLLVLAAMMLTVWGAPAAFTITALAWGGILMALAQYFRHRSAERLLSAHAEAQRLQQERALWHHQQVQLGQLLTHGLPPSLPLEEVRALIAPEREADRGSGAMPEAQQRADAEK